MPYRVHINGILVECDTAREVRELADSPVKSSPSNSSAPSVRTRRQNRRQRALVKSRDFLEALDVVGEGLTNAELVTVLRLDNAAAIGGVITPLNRILRESKLEPSTVYGRGTNEVKEPTWVPGPQLDKGRIAIKEILKGGEG